MAQHCIKGKRIRRVCIPKEYDIDKIQIGIPVICDEAKTVGLIKNGDVVLPSGIFGAQCRRNAYGYSYADKSKPKERRYVSTNWVHPFGNTNASEVAVDIYRPCWPQVEVPPYGIELQLFKSKDGQLYVIVVLTDEIRANYLKEAVNILLEIYGVTDFRSRFISMRSRIRSFVYSLPSDFVLPRTKRSLSRGRKEMYLAALSSKDSPLISYPLALIKSKKSSYVEADLVQKLMSLLSWVFQVEPFCSDCHSLYFLPRSPPGMMMERLCSLHSSSLSFRMW